MTKATTSFPQFANAAAEVGTQACLSPRHFLDLFATKASVSRSMKMKSKVRIISDGGVSILQEAMREGHRSGERLHATEVSRGTFETRSRRPEG